MRQSGPKNVVTYEVIDKRRPRQDRLVAAYKKEADAEALALKLQLEG